jgi:hypothetical protein
MWGILIAFAAVGGLVAVACREKDDPFIKPTWQKIRLATLAGTPANQLTLAQAEDGVVLSRKLGEKVLERRFAMVARRLKEGRR